MCHLVTLPRKLWREISKNMLFMAISVKNNFFISTKQFKKVQKCHVTLCLSPSFPLYYLVTLLQTPPPRLSRIIWLAPNSIINVMQIIVRTIDGGPLFKAIKEILFFLTKPVFDVCLTWNKNMFVIICLRKIK